MDYAEMQAAFLVAAPGAMDKPAPPVPDTPARRLRDAVEPLAGVVFWSRPAYDAMAALGLEFLTGYVWGRTAPMGDVASPVAVAAFGVFEPDLVTGLLERARGLATREQVLAARERGAVAALRELLGEVDVTAEVALLRRATDVAVLDVAGRALFAGLASLPWPTDPLGQLWHACSLLREHRGDVHQAATVAAGLTGLQANLVTEHWLGWEPTTYAGTRGWSPEAMAAADADLAERGWVADGALTPQGRQRRTAIEEQTDALMARVLAPIGEELDALVAQLDAWSALVVAGGAAPPDVYKRVSG